MNRRMVVYTVGQIIKLEAVLLCLPLAVALIYGDSSVVGFLTAIGVSLVLGFGLTLFFKPTSKTIYAKEGFVLVAFAWITMSLIGAIPFTVSGEIPSYIDAVFETVSGFTTTGASILTDVESMSRGLLFWRSFTHWIGGMGVLVFIMAISNSLTDRSIHIMRAEIPGPVVGKLVPKAKDTAKILYLIYITITFLEVIFLLLGGMPFFDALVHSFGTAGTGGFGIRAQSIGAYSPYVQWVITVFMLLFGINFNLYYLLLLRRVRSVFKSEEMWFYFGLFGVCATLMTINILPLYKNVSEAIRLSAFQVASLVTTTGYATADFNQWPGLSRALVLMLLFTGSCAGSTAGGFKLSRIIMLFKSARRNLRKMLHPRSVSAVRFEGKKVDEETLNGVHNYFAVYIALFVLIFIALSFEPFDLLTNFTAAASCINNVGPGLGIVGPAGGYSGFSDISKIILSFAMLLGRLEIYPILFLFSPSTWKKK